MPWFESVFVVRVPLAPGPARAGSRSRRVPLGPGGGGAGRQLRSGSAGQPAAPAYGCSGSRCLALRAFRK